MNKSKICGGIILGSKLPKNERNYWNIVEKKKKRKILNPASWERLNQSTQTSLRRTFYWSFSPSNEQSTNFYSNQGLDFQYEKENDQECTVKNPALKSLGRWNEEGMRREWVVANNRAKVAFWWWNRNAKQGKVPRLKCVIIAPSALWIEDSLARVMCITFDSDRIWQMHMVLIIQLETSIASFRGTTSVSKLLLYILPSCFLVGLNHNYLLWLHYKLQTFPLRFKALESLLIRKKKKKRIDR